MRIDAHHHFWRPERGDYGWLTPDLAPLDRTFGPDDFAPLLDAAGLGGGVLAQAAPTEAGTDYLLALFAPERLMVGSDWSVATVDALAAPLDNDAKASLWGGAAQAFHDLAERPAAP